MVHLHKHRQHENKDTNLLVHHNTNAVPQQQTTVTTTTQTAPGAIIQKNIPTTNVLQKEAIVTNVMEKPILENVIERKNVEVHHKNVIQEVHDQKVRSLILLLT